MKAGYYTGDFGYEVRDIPERRPIADEVKIRVAWCGLCGTDIHKFQGKTAQVLSYHPLFWDMSVPVSLQR